MAAQQAPTASAGVRSGEVRIDGKIDEAAWTKAPVIKGFQQSEPNDGGPASHDTEVRVLFDAQAVYIAARMFDEPASVRRPLVRRDEDESWMDWFGVSFDPDRDGRTGYQFRVNAAGVQQDLFLSEDSNSDPAWNAVWESAVGVDSLGWTAELRIPLSQIRYDGTAGLQTWGVNFHRRRAVNAELSHFALQSRRISGIVSQFGLLQNVKVPTSVRRIEARPYVLSSLHDGPAAAGDPFFDGRATSARVGSDFRLGLGSSFTLDATFNPDFGQVEADPADINLTAFETFFPEQRPFFVEDAQVFSFDLSSGRNQMFYSRRIGGAPKGRAPSGASFVDMASATNILGAGKLTGRTSKGLSLGALTAVTQAETGHAYFLSDGHTVDFGAAPRTGFGVLSAKQDFRGGMAQMSALFTAVDRSLGPDLGFLPSQAFSGGLRLDNQWQKRRYRVQAFLLGSRVQGSTDAMVQVQRSSNHYFQRPDATRVRLDSTATSLSGVQWRLQLDRQNADWTGSYWMSGVTKGNEINDIGFSGVRERFEGGAQLNYKQFKPGRIFRDYNFQLRSFYNFSFEMLDDPGSWSTWRHAYTNGNFQFSSGMDLLNYWGASLNVTWVPDLYSQTATRGGPVMLQPKTLQTQVNFNSDKRQLVNFNGGLNVMTGGRASLSSVGVNAGINLRPSPQLQLELDPSFTVQTDRTQYVTTSSALAYAPTYGKRYFFGDLERTTLGLTARANYTLSPTFSLQVFANPLLSTGDYVEYKQLATSGSFDFVRFKEGQAVVVGGKTACVGGTICRDAAGNQQIDLNGDGFADTSFADKDFNVRTLIGNAVLRWEYRPGSTIFLVWQRQQNAPGTLADFDLRRDASALWSAPGDNRFIVKVNYWIGL